MNSALKALCLDTTDPAYNLALEEALFKNLPAGHPGWFLLWQNSPSVIVGRHQSTSLEVNLAGAKNLNIPIYRRITGGGTVYHDPGNLNFSFIINSPHNIKPDFQIFLMPICRALNQIGVRAKISGRNDLAVDGKKISGNSQIRSGNKILHHGTLLINTDFHTMLSLLTPKRDKLAKHGVDSVLARVGNISDYWNKGTNLDKLKRLLLETSKGEPCEISYEDLKIAKYMSQWKYQNKNWNYDLVFAYNKIKRAAFPWGQIEVYIYKKNNIIEDISIRGDFFSNQDISMLENIFKGVLITEYLRKLKTINFADYFANCDNKELQEFFATI